MAGEVLDMTTAKLCLELSSQSMFTALLHRRTPLTVLCPSVFYKANVGFGATAMSFYMAYGGTNWGYVISVPFHSYL